MALMLQAELTWPEAEDVGKRDDVVGLIPTGALEQHGPHLPLGTDFLAAGALARAVAERLPVPVVVTPTLTAGLSDHHLAFPGTVSLSRETFGGWIEAHIAGLERIGIGRVAVVSGHGGNFAFIGELAAEYAARAGTTRVIAYDDLLGFVRVMDEAAREHMAWKRLRRTSTRARSRRAWPSRGSSRDSCATSTASRATRPRRKAGWTASGRTGSQR